MECILKRWKGNKAQTGCHSREEGYAAFLSSQSPLQRSGLKWRIRRVTDSGNEHRVDALEFTSIPCNLKMQVHPSRIVLHAFDKLVKELCALEKTTLMMGEGVYGVILRITNASRVFHFILAFFFPHTLFISCFCIASCRWSSPLSIHTHSCECCFFNT